MAVINGTLYGENGNDVLLGGNGNDILYGDENNDALKGEAGGELLDGGNMPDVKYTMPTGDVRIDALLSGVAWATPNLTYHFAQSPAEYEPGNPYANSTSFAPLSAAGQANMRACLEAWDEVCGLEFTEVASGGDILVANSYYPGAAGWAYYPSTSPYGGDIWFDSGYQTSSHVGLHEIGHAVGLKHPHDGSPNLPAGFDSTDFTHMSYSGSWDTWTGPALFDILAIQYLYGADYTTRADDTVYKFGTGSPDRTIWDGGGTDRVDTVTLASPVSLDLNQGAFSLAGDARIAIAYGVVIENASTGAGNDSVVGNEVGNVLSGNDGGDTLLGNSGDDRLYGGNSTDTLDGGADNDYLDGGYGDDVYLFTGSFGQESISSHVGIDTLIFDMNKSQVTYEFSGSDLFIIKTGTADQVVIEDYDYYSRYHTLQFQDGIGSPYGGGDGATAGNDTLEGTSGADSIDALAGNDTVHAGLGSDIVYGNSGDDYLDGGGDRDSIWGNAGNDYIYAGDGNDLAYGDSVGLTGTDTMYGGNGNDVLAAGNGNDAVFGGSGNDRMYGDAGDDRVYGETGNDIVYGGLGNDRVHGDDGNDSVYGDDGNDTMTGGAGNDSLEGGIGNDSITGGAGLDWMRGDAGVDRFVFDDGHAGIGANRDVIVAFEAVDLIDLSAVDAKSAVAGDQVFTWRGTGGFTGAGQLHYVVSGANKIIQGSTDADAAPELEILLQGYAGTPNVGDFVL